MERPAHSPPWHLNARGLAFGVFSALVAWLVVLSHLTSTLHFALISHEVCAAHGELVHGRTRLALGAVLAQRANGHEPVAVPGDADPAHEHCPLIGSRHEQATLVAGQALVATTTPCTTVASPEGVLVRPSRASLLLVAPKQSPPV